MGGDCVVGWEKGFKSRVMKGLVEAGMGGSRWEKSDHSRGREISSIQLWVKCGGFLIYREGTMGCEGLVNRGVLLVRWRWKDGGDQKGVYQTKKPLSGFWSAPSDLALIPLSKSGIKKWRKAFEDRMAAFGRRAEQWISRINIYAGKPIGSHGRICPADLATSL
jgi:hypothetical protein